MDGFAAAAGVTPVAGAAPSPASNSARSSRFERRSASTTVLPTRRIERLPSRSLLPSRAVRSLVARCSRPPARSADSSNAAAARVPRPAPGRPPRRGRGRRHGSGVQFLEARAAGRWFPTPPPALDRWRPPRRRGEGPRRPALAVRALRRPSLGNGVPARSERSDVSGASIPNRRSVPVEPLSETDRAIHANLRAPYLRSHSLERIARREAADAARDSRSPWRGPARAPRVSPRPGSAGGPRGSAPPHLTVASSPERSGTAPSTPSIPAWSGPTSATTPSAW